METARVAGYVAVITSLGALVTVFMYVPALVVKINGINDKVGNFDFILIIDFIFFQLKVDSDEFRIIADEAWTELIVAKGNYPGDRIRRQAYGEGLPRTYPLPNKYAKKDAFVTAPTCCKFLRLVDVYSYFS